MWKSLLLALALLPGLTAPAVAQSAGASPAGPGPAAGPPVEVAKHIADVASADAGVQEAAAVALGKTGDRKILPLLEALREGSVYVRPLPGGKKETVIVGDKVSEGDKTLVPLFRAYGREPIVGPDGKPLLADLTTLEEVSTGRSLRIAIRPLIDAFSGQSDLVNPDPATRRAAATKMGYTGDAATRQVLEDALGKERDRWARFALEEAIALIRLRTGGEAERVAAAEALGRLRSANAMEPLYQIAGDAQAPAPLAAAARASIKRIERWGLFTQAIEIAFQGLSLSSILLLMALGLAIVFGLMGVINMAHGELMALGAYATFLMQGWFTAYFPAYFDYYFLVALPFSFLVSAGGRVPARARRDPLPLRPPARDAAPDLGREPDDPAGPAAVVRGGQRGRDLAPLALGRHPGDDRRPAPVQPALHHRARHASAWPRCTSSSSAPTRACASARSPRTAGWPPAWGCGRAGSTRAPSPSARGWPAWPAARSPRSATWDPSSARTTSWTRSWWW